MKHNRNKINPVQTLIFVMIGAVLIVATDLFILGGKQHVWNQTKPVQEQETVRTSNLRAQHALYMDKGIDTTSYLPDIAQLNAVEPASGSVNEDEQSQQGRDSLGQMELVEELSIDELIASEKATELSHIKPASGVGAEIRSSFKPTAATSPIQSQQHIDHNTDKSVLEVISDLGLKSDDVIIPPKSSNIADIRLSSNEDKPSHELIYESPKGKGQISIIIDDMGLGLRSKLVEVMDGPLTLAYLPYGKNLQERTERAKKHGHEIMVHMPMEAMNTKLDGGPKVLRGTLDDAQFQEILEWDLSQFTGYVGVNNHMGSRLTQDKRAMARVMAALKKRDLYFVDSKTIGSSVAADMAKQAGLSYAERDIFLDHEITPEFINGALRKLERVASQKGHAIGIGHPHQATITALKAWIPTLKDKGFTLVPASALLHHPDNITQSDAVAESTH